MSIFTVVKLNYVDEWIDLYIALCSRALQNLLIPRYTYQDNILACSSKLWNYIVMDVSPNRFCKTIILYFSYSY